MTLPSAGVKDIRYGDHYFEEENRKGKNKKSADCSERCSRFKEELTRFTAWAALAVRHGGIGTRDQRAGDFATHSRRVLEKGTDEVS